jgi:hypothetical protein
MAVTPFFDRDGQTAIAEERLGVASEDRRNQTHGEKAGRCER